MTTPLRSLKETILARQHNRILRLSFPNHDGPSCQFLANKLDAVEALSRDFEYTVEILSDHPALALKDIIGKLICVELVQQAGTLRYFSGYCFSFRLNKTGAIACYEAKLYPWLKYLSLRKNNYLFHHASLYQQTDSILRHYGCHAQWEFRVQGQHAPMTQACQFDETDSNYLHRRWEAAGLHYFYEHTAKGHILILSDDSTQAAPINGAAAIRFQHHGGAQEENAISAWTPVRDLVPSRVALNAFNFKDPRPASIDMPSLNQQGQVLPIESYEYAGAYGFQQQDDAGDRLARLRMEEMEALGKHVEAAGNNRNVQPGRSFQLVDHQGNALFNRDKKNDFLILSVHHLASNNYGQDATPPSYSNRLSCSRKTIPWRPGRHFNSIDTKIVAPQTAIVVGPDGQGSIYTDQYGRIRVQFHWDRKGAPDHSCSAWVRVSSAWAGAQLGAAAIPRVKSEVIVQWLDGSPDHPIVTGCLHNAQYLPPWALPQQHALTGLRSRELTLDGGNRSGGRSNHLILDDTHHNIQAQLKSDHQQSQLSLGHITRIDSHAGRLNARGEGWELASDAWGVARAGKGMLITTEARLGAASPIKDMAETVARLKRARERQTRLTEAALRSGAPDPAEPEVAASIAAQNAAIEGIGGTLFPELAAPHLVLASPAGIATTSKHSTHIASDEHTALTTGKNLAIAAGVSLFANVQQTLRLFVHKAGMKLIAAAGKVSIQAQSDDIELIANKVLSLISESDWIELRAKKGIRLHGGQQMLEISDLVQFFTSSPVLFHGNLETLTPENKPQQDRARPAAPVSEQLQYILQSNSDGAVHANAPYALYQGDAKVANGITDEYGSIFIEHQDGSPHYRVKLPTGEEFALPVSAKFVASTQPQHSEQTQSNQGLRALDATQTGRRHD